MLVDLFYFLKFFNIIFKKKVKQYFLSPLFPCYSCHGFFFFLLLFLCRIHVDFLSVNDKEHFLIFIFCNPIKGLFLSVENKAPSLSVFGVNLFGLHSLLIELHSPCGLNSMLSWLFRDNDCF